MPTDKIESMDTQKIANIMSVALEEFAQNSYDKSSYNQIIKKSGMSKGTMYYYFKSKEDLFNTLLSATIKEFKPLAKLKTNQEDELTFWADMWRLCYGSLFLLQQKPSIGNFARNLLCSENRDYDSQPLSYIRKLMQDLWTVLCRDKWQKPLELILHQKISFICAGLFGMLLREWKESMI